MANPSFQAAPKRKCRHTFWKEILEEIRMKHCKKFFYLDPPPAELSVFWRSLNCCEPICLLVPTPGLSSSPFLEPTGLAEGTLLPGKDFISLCTSYPFRDRCHHGEIVGDRSVPVPSSAQLLQNISTCSMANQRGVSSCISFAFSCSIHTCLPAQTTP